MTVSSQTSRVSYAGNGSTTAFAVSFYFLADSHLKVILRAADGSETVKTLSSDYTVSGAGNPSGGTVTMNVAPTSGTTLVIVRNVPLTQETDYQANDPFPAESHERALDKLTMAIQTQQLQVDRAIKVPASTPSGISADLPNPEANTLLAWNEDGDALRNMSPQTLVTVVAYAAAYADTFTGDGKTVDWTLTRNPGTLYNLDVSIDGVTQVPVTDYTLSETTFTTTTAAPVGSVILVKYREGLTGSAAADSKDVRFVKSSGAVSDVQTILRSVDAAGEYGNNYIAAGQPANLNGYGQGGFKVGGGTPESTNGMWLSLDGASNWLRVQVSKNENPTEIVMYSSSGQGYATTVSGTNQITRVWGSEFQSRWVGNTIYFLRKKFKVASVVNANTLTVTELGGQSVTFTITETEAYNYVYTSGSGLCNVSGTTVTFVSGDPFVPLFFSDFKFTLNGVTRTVASFDSNKQYTLASAPGDGVNVPFTWQGNINDQITTLRVQAIQGSNEENVNLMSIAGDNFLGRHYALVAGFAGTYGRFRPIFIGSGSYTDYSYQHQIGCYPRNMFPGVSTQGYVSLGGVQGREGLRVYNPNASTPLANRISTQAAPTGYGVSFRAEGSDSNITFDIDTKGTGEFRVTQDYARTLFKAQGNGSTVNWLSIGASNSGSPVVVGVDQNSANTDVSLTLAPKGSGDIIMSTSGTGKVRLGNVTVVSGGPAVAGYITVKDYSGNLVKIATIA